MATSDEGVIFDIDPKHEPDDQDEDEVEIDNEVARMLRGWDRGVLMEEVEEEKKRIEASNDDTKDIYYDGSTGFKELMKDMTAFEGGKVYMRTLEANPEGRQITASCSVQYDRVGYIEHEDVPFESTIIEGTSSLVKLGDSPSISGLIYALLQLREGERANVILHPSMAYGPLGCLPVIPPNSYVFYNIKVHKVWEESLLDYALEQEIGLDKLELPIKERVEFIKKHKEVANQFLRDELPKEAIVRYKAALTYLNGMDDNLINRSPEIRNLRVTLLQNLAIAFNRCKFYKSASNAAKRALFIDPENIKVLYNLAKARFELEDYHSALKYIDMATKISPNNSSFINLKACLDSKFVDEKKRKDEIMRKASRGVFML